MESLVVWTLGFSLWQGEGTSVCISATAGSAWGVGWVHVKAPCGAKIALCSC